jgi:hypothetical protein
MLNRNGGELARAFASRKPRDRASSAGVAHQRLGVIVALGAWAVSGAPLAAQTTAPSEPPNREPIEVRVLERTIEGAPVRCFVAVIDLMHPSVDIVVTQPLAGTACEARPIATDAWAASEKTTLAVNANFFARLEPDCLDVLGLSMSDTAVISNVRATGDRADPAIVFREDRRAAVGYFKDIELSGVKDAVAGIGASGSEPAPATLLVHDGKNLGGTARVAPTARHPRTAAGVSADGATLYLVVVDGRQPEWSIGMTLPELADLMIELGADDALNLDGGGSSAFVFTPTDDSKKTQNRPSDGSFRAVANHLGIRLVTPEEHQPANDSQPAPQDSPNR